MDSTAIKFNYYALVVAILAKCPPELAFEKLESDHPDSIRPRLTEDDLEDIATLRTEGITWDDLGEMYGKKPNNLLVALKRKGLGRWQPMSPKQEAIEDARLCDMPRNPEAGGADCL